MDKITIEILQLSPQRIKFILNGCDVSLANALRRTLIAEVPTLAPHLVSIIQNTSALHDQFLCQRIGLIPFVSELVDKFKYPWQCSCGQQNVQDCQICKAYFVLEAKNLDQDIMEVTSLSIRPVYQPLKAEEDEYMRPVLPVHFSSDLIKGKSIGIPIVKLAHNQEIKVRFEVQKGIGKMHAKWSPVSLATFRTEPDIKMDQTIELPLQWKMKIRDSCPAKVFQIHQDVFQVANPDKCIYCGECKNMAESIDMDKLKNFLRIGINLVNLGKKKDRFIFEVQSVGSLPASTIVKKSMYVLRQKLKEIQESIK